MKGVYYSVVVRRIRPYFGCGIRLLQENQCGVYGFCIAMQLRKIGISTNCLRFSLTS